MATLRGGINDLMDVPDKPVSPDAVETAAAAAPSSRSAPVATSQGFFPPLAPHVLRRSLVLSAIASTLGAAFFTVVQGTVFNFFLEDLSLRDRLPYFMGLWCVGSLGTLLGSWIQERWGCRKALFLWGVGGSRIVWLAIGLIPLLRPEWIKPGPAMWWLSILTLLFYFVHALGANAWLSWMADLVPSHLQGRYWSLRQVGCSLSGIAARVGFGYYLQHHRHMGAFAIIFGIAAVLGIADALLFLGVEHRRPKLNPEKPAFFREFMGRLQQAPFRRLIGVYLLWNISNCIMAPTCYFFMRDRVGMDVAGISTVEAIALAGFTAFSLLWGKFSDHHGHRGPLVMCLLVQGICPVFYFFARHGDDHLVALAMAVGSIGFCGINLFMWPMLIDFTKGQGGRVVGMAAFTVVTGLANFLTLVLVVPAMYEIIGRVLSLPARHHNVYLNVMGVAMILRFSGAILAWTLPERKEETSPGHVISLLMTTNPLRATLSFFKFVAGKERWEGSKTKAKSGEGKG